MKMTDDELEIAILQRFVEQYKIGEAADPDRRDRCARELDMRQVINELTKEEGQALEFSARLWYTRLVSTTPGPPKVPLRSCSNSTLKNAAHRYNARAFLNPSASSLPAWDRIRQLTATISEQQSRISTKEVSEKIEKVIGRHQRAKGKLNEFAVREYFELYGYKAKKTTAKLDQMKIDVVAENSTELIYTQVKLGQISISEIEKVIKSILELKTRSKKTIVVAFVANRFPNNSEMIRQNLEQRYGLPLLHIHSYQVLAALPEYRNIIEAVDN